MTSSLIPPKKSDKPRKTPQPAEIDLRQPATRPSSKYELQRRFIKSGYFFGALLFHLIIFILIATWVIFRAPQPPKEIRFQAVAPKPQEPIVIPPPPPSDPSSETGGADSPEMALPESAVQPVITTPLPSQYTLPYVTVTPPKIPGISTSTSGPGPTSTPHPPGPPRPPYSPVPYNPTMLTGYLYDLKQASDRSATNMNPGAYHGVLKQFIEKNWNESILNKYYKSPKPLSTDAIFIPTLKAEEGPKAYNVEKEVKPTMYVILYKATVSPTQDGTYHFVGTGDDILAVRVNGKTVLDGCGGAAGGIWDGRDKQDKYAMTNFNPTCGPDGEFKIGTPIQARAGDKFDIEVLIGEEPGGRSNYFLYVQRDEDLANYTKQANGAPLLPIFQLTPDTIKPQGEAETYPPFAAAPAPWNAVQ